MCCLELMKKESRGESLQEQVLKMDEKRQEAFARKNFDSVSRECNDHDRLNATDKRRRNSIEMNIFQHKGVGQRPDEAVNCVTKFGDLTKVWNYSKDVEMTPSSIRSN